MTRVVFATLIASFAFTAPARSEDPLAARVRESLNKGVDFLKRKQNSKGGGVWNWENDTIALLQEGGTSTLAMLALLTAGVSTDDEVVRRGMPYVRSLPPKHTYVVGLQTMVLAEAGQVRDLDQIQKNANWLVEGAVVRNGKLGAAGAKLEGWTYKQSDGSPADNSNTQYALLGLWSAKQAGATIDPEVWKTVQEFYTRTQLKAILDNQGREMAGWDYRPGQGLGKGTLTMTSAGVCGLFIAAQQLGGANQGLDEATGIAKNCGTYPDDDAVAKGMRWLAKELRFASPPHTFYNVYGIERVGRLSGQRFIGDHDWYREGCQLLTGLADDKIGLAQKATGEWVASSALDQFPVISTSFAVLFLAKGRTPILLSKLAWDGPTDRPGNGTGWNRKHNDARNLVEYASREVFRAPGSERPFPLAWQIFDPRVVSLGTPKEIDEELSTLLQSPILYINGHEAPTLTPAQKRLLRRYVDEGGFILAEACCGSKAFAEGFKKLLADKDMFGDDAVLEPLQPTHAIWSAHSLVPASIFQGEQVPADQKIMSLERGCKTVVVFSPQPLAGYWEESRFAPKPKEVVDRDRGKLAFRLAGNIIAYATGYEPPKPRLDRPKVVEEVNSTKPVARNVVQLAQVRHDGGDWQPAKNAMRALAANARDKYLIDVSLVKAEVRLTHPKEVFRNKFLYMHGKAKFTTDENEANAVRSHLKSGGTILADACCGSDAFDKAFREFVAKSLPGSKLEIIPVDDLLYSEKLNGEAITRVRCRREKADGTPQANYEEIAPMLEGVRIDDRWAIIYSKYDIGCALEKSKSSACKGYEPESAMKLATAALLYSLKR